MTFLRSIGFHTAWVTLCALALQGFQLELRQASAWMNMIVTYSQGSDFVTALNETFSGERPCEHCTAIADERVGQAESANLLPPPQPDEPLSLQADATPSVVRPAPLVTGTLPAESLPYAPYRMRPPTPPPRMIFS